MNTREFRNCRKKVLDGSSCWVHYVPLMCRKEEVSLPSSRLACKKPRFSFKINAGDICAMRRNTCCMMIPSTPDKEPNQLVVPVVSVPDEKSVMTPGELRQVSLDYELFQSILKSGSTCFGCIKADEYSFGITGVSGALVTLLMVKGVEREDGPRVVLDCRCSSRLTVLSTASESENSNVTMARVQKVRDHPLDSFAERREVSQLEWRLWNTCKEISSLQNMLENDQLPSKTVEQELAVWAPKAYDKEIEEHEWNATPYVTRQVFWDRAECFSFGILRCMQGDETVTLKARHTTKTLERLRMAIAFLQEKKALTYAQLSLKKALD